ncbi:TPA: hypothetical protein U1C34_001911 [Streptococcus suis]|nr:hypothetical protein [Streptococcus suis]HEM3613663.1 hypothetical protein [Streptococcus suis]HEM3623097.1 hypothetical protein [Streptococcus suis]HEM3627550.1 hypothetical protein [Streptococcus suis]HEM3631887.1 hypothetical protein [Streptococcus suis]
MEIKDLVLKNGILKDLVYLGQVDTLNSFNGVSGQFQVHQVTDRKGMIFHVVTKASADLFEVKSAIELVNPTFFVDELYGASTVPAINVQAEKIVKK